MLIFISRKFLFSFIFCEFFFFIITNKEKKIHEKTK